MTALLDIAQAIAAALTPVSPSDDITVLATRTLKPTPPCIDIYPDTPFLSDASFGSRSVEMRWLVRARVGANDLDGQTELLYALMDPDGADSVRGALLSDKTLGGVVANLDVDGLTGVLPYQDVPGEPMFPGCAWSVTVYNKADGA